MSLASEPMTDWPTNWTRIPTLAMRNKALRNAEAAAAECARRRREREAAEEVLRQATQHLQPVRRA